MKKRYYMIMALVCTMTTVFGQKQDSTASADKTILTIDQCISIAMENNIELKRVKNNARIAKANDFQAIMNFLPSLNAQMTYNFNYGTRINSFGDFADVDYQDSYPGISGELVVFRGMSRHYYKKATESNLEASVSGVRAQELSVQSSVLGSYLNVVIDKENIRISSQRKELLNIQLVREEQRVEIGVGNLEQVYNFKSQLANENLRYVNLQNRLLTDMLNLLQVLQLDVTPKYDVAPYDFEKGEHLTDVEDFNDLLTSILQYSPEMKQAEASADAALYNFKSIRGRMMPTMSVYGNVATQYSTLNVRNNAGGSAEEIPYAEQLRELNNQAVGVRLNIPIFNNYQANNQSQVAKIDMDNAKLQLEQTELNVTNSIQRVYLDLLSAQETYKAAQENLVALTQSYDYVKTRYDTGNTDFYTYLESLNNKNRAEIELVNARYSIIFRKKILDVYRGLL